MNEQPSAERAREIEEQRQSRERLEQAAEELRRNPPHQPTRKDTDERWPDNVPVWERDSQGNLKKVA